MLFLLGAAHHATVYKLTYNVDVAEVEQQVQDYVRAEVCTSGGMWCCVLWWGVMQSGQLAVWQSGIPNVCPAVLCVPCDHRVAAPTCPQAMRTGSAAAGAAAGGYACVAYACAAACLRAHLPAAPACLG